MGFHIFNHCCLSHMNLIFKEKLASIFFKKRMMILSTIKVGFDYSTATFLGNSVRTLTLFLMFLFHEKGVDGKLGII